MVSPEYEDIRGFYEGYAFAQVSGATNASVVDRNFNIVVAEIAEGKLYAHEREGGQPLEWVNGYCTLSGGWNTVFVDHLGNRVKIGYNIDKRYGTITHLSGIKIGGGRLAAFVDYDDNILFAFEPDEFLIIAYTCISI